MNSERGNTEDLFLREHYAPPQSRAEPCPAWWGRSGMCPGKEPLHWSYSANKQHGSSILNSVLSFSSLLYWMVEIGRQPAALWLHVAAQENVQMTHTRLVYYYCPIILVMWGYLKLVQHQARLKIGLGLCCARDTPPTLRRNQAFRVLSVERDHWTLPRVKCSEHNITWEKDHVGQHSYC